MLLIFFLVTTQIDSDKGLMRQLPPPDLKDETAMNVKEQDMLQLALDADDQLSCNGKRVSMEEARQQMLRFLSDKRLLNRGIVSVQTDRNTSYEAYFHLQDVLVGVYAQMRDNLAVRKFGKPMRECTDEQRKQVQKLLPQRISEQQATEQTTDQATEQTTTQATASKASAQNDVKGGAR